MENIVYLGLDVHVQTCVLAAINEQGEALGCHSIDTQASALIRAVNQIRAHHKQLTLEEGPMAHWIGQALKAHVDELVICDPRYNRSIGAQANKNDRNDAYQLARLLRLRELKEVYHPPQMHRAIFKSAAKQYLEMTRQQTQIKLKIKNKFRAWQVTQLGAQQVYHLRHREKFLKQLNHPDLVGQFSILYELLQSAQQAQRQSLQQLCQLGKRYSEIQQFLKIPGVGPITAHLFDAYIQDPHRFATKQKLWRYAQLGIVDRSSNGKPLGYRRLDRNGNSLLKHISYQIWKASLQTKQPNEVRDYFQRSLNTTGNRIHARLNTQRKILAVMWTVWKHQQAYQAQKFIAAAQPELVTRTQPS